MYLLPGIVAARNVHLFAMSSGARCTRNTCKTEECLVEVITAAGEIWID